MQQRRAPAFGFCFGHQVAQKSWGRQERHLLTIQRRMLEPEPVHRAAAGALARPTWRLQVLRRQGSLAVRRQGEVAAQPGALVLPQVGDARAAQAANGYRDRRHSVSAGRNADPGTALRGRSRPSRATAIQRQAARRQALSVHPHQRPGTVAKDDGCAQDAARWSALLRAIYRRHVSTPDARYRQSTLPTHTVQSSDHWERPAGVSVLPHQALSSAVYRRHQQRRLSADRRPDGRLSRWQVRQRAG